MHCILQQVFVILKFSCIICDSYFFSFTCVSKVHVKPILESGFCTYDQQVHVCGGDSIIYHSNLPYELQSYVLMIGKF